VSTSELIARGAAFPEVGVSPELERVAFSLSVGDVSDVVDTGNTVAIVRVVERQEAKLEELVQSTDALRTELLQTRQNQFYNSYMSRVQGELSIDIDYSALDVAIGA
jgi:parvulin-like peptidyl-prolyl isomerase